MPKKELAKSAAKPKKSKAPITQKGKSKAAPVTQKKKKKSRRKTSEDPIRDASWFLDTEAVEAGGSETESDVSG